MLMMDWTDRHCRVPISPDEKPRASNSEMMGIKFISPR
jgi:hypothetical protein